MKEKINNQYRVETLGDFEDATAYFLSDNLKDERQALYEQKKINENLESLAAAKHNILKQIFSNYVYNSLNNAKLVNEQGRSLEAKKYIDNLLKLRKIFKNHDVLDYQEFIAESEPAISQVEVNLLFLEPILNVSELDNLNKAFITAFGKKHNILENKRDFQKAFYNHPLINCLSSHNDYESIVKQVNNDVLELGKYKDLIKTILSLKASINNEEYQGFIFYVIKEDLTKGLKNILQIENYQPEYLKDLLNLVTQGEEINNKVVQHLIKQIKEQHSVNFAMNNQKELSQNKSSKFSLNDSGFFFDLQDREYFFHAHETSNSGVNQEEQQANTANILREKGHDSLGVTVLSHQVTRTDHHRTFIRENKLHEKLNLNKMEELIITGLQFDAANFKRIATQDISVDLLKNDDFLASNQYIVKNDIQRSVQLIDFLNGKNDYELLLEKKSVYLNIVNKNKEFFKDIIELTSTKNEMSYQLLSNPFLDFVNALLKIEKKAKINLLSETDINTINHVLSAKTLNTDLKNSIEDTLDKIENRNHAQYKDINNSIQTLSELVNKEQITDIHIDGKIEKSEEAQKFAYLSKQFKSGTLKPDLKQMSNILSSINLSNPEVSKQGRTALKKNLHAAIYDLSEKTLMEYYRYDKTNWMLDGISIALEKMVVGESINFKKSSYSQIVTYQHEQNMNMLLSTLLKESNKTEKQKINDLQLFSILLSFAEQCNSQINCSNKKVTKDTLKI